MQIHLLKCLVSTTRLLSLSSVSTLDMALDAPLGGMAAPATPHADTFGSVPVDFLTFLESIDEANALSGEQYVKIAECFMVPWLMFLHVSCMSRLPLAGQ